MNQERISSKQGDAFVQGEADGRPSFRRGPSGRARAIGALAASAVTFVLLHSVTSLFMSASEVQMAKSHSNIFVASVR